MALLPKFPVDANQPLVVAFARESLRMRVRQSIHSRTTIVLAALIAVAAFSGAVPLWRVLAWGVPVACMAQVNAWLCARLLKGLDDADAGRLAGFQTALWWMTIFNQALLGATVWWIGYNQPGTVATIATTLQLIYVGGALVNASTHPPTFISGAWINLTMAAAFWLTQSELGWPLAFALLGMGLVVSKSSRQSAAAFQESLRMRFENADLVKKLEREKQLAEEANAAKSRFLAAASHDLRQPLHALMVFSTLLHKNQTPQTAELVSHIRSAAGSLDKLFAGLLDLSKLESGAVVPQLQAVHVNSLAEEMVREYDEPAHAKGLTLSSDGPSLWALSDPFLLERVLRNLIDNAVKYTSQGHVTVHLAHGPSECVIEVRDSGAGIAPDLQTRIFEEYFQVGNSARDLAKGSGLGLAIVKRLCNLLNAPLELDSAPGRGSVFRISLQSAPIQDSAGSGRAVGRDELLNPTRLAGLRIWVVEDNELVRIATRRALEEMGAEVQAWPGMPEPLPTHPVPDALVADYRLEGGMTGLDIARAARGNWPRLPVAIVTGDPSIDHAGLQKLGNIVILQKPVVPAVLGSWLHARCGLARRPRTLEDAQAILTP